MELQPFRLQNLFDFYATKAQSHKGFNTNVEYFNIQFINFLKFILVFL